MARGRAWARVGGRPAGPGGVVPYFRRTPGGFVSVGFPPRGRAPAARGRAATPAGAPAAGGAAPAPANSPQGAGVYPPLPFGSFNPERQVQIQESERGLGQLEDSARTAAVRDTGDYGIRKSQYEQDYNQAQARLKQQFTQLAGRQQEQANAAGVLEGGAALQAAQKRAANEGKVSGEQTQARDRQLAALALDLEPPSGYDETGKPIGGGREFQDIATRLGNAQSTNAFFAKSQRALMGGEAGAAGVELPGGYQKLLAGLGITPPASSSGQAPAPGQPPSLAHHRAGAPWARVGGRQPGPGGVVPNFRRTPGGFVSVGYPPRRRHR